MLLSEKVAGRNPWGWQGLWQHRPFRGGISPSMAVHVLSCLSREWVWDLGVALSQHGRSHLGPDCPWLTCLPRAPWELYSLAMWVLRAGQGPFCPGPHLCTDKEKPILAWSRREGCQLPFRGLPGA